VNNAINFKAKSFISERDTSSIAFEVKRTRATWDPSLAVPGTERRGGWRCPPGTNFGGQITDRFGRNCGWGVSRRLANSITDLGERLENIGDRRRGRRAARAAERVSRPGLVERAAGRVAEVLDGDDSSTIKPPRARRGAAVPDTRRPRQGKPNLRSSEKRRMNREIDNPGAPRTGEGDAAPPIGRPRPAAPRARRRNAPADVVERKPKPVVDAPEQVRVPAGLPNPDETLAQYKRRKYNEHQARVRKIREEGGNAGFLTFDEWQRFHGPMVEDNWNRGQARNGAAPDAPAVEPAKVPAKKVPAKKKAAVKKAAARRATPAVREDDQPDWEAFGALPDGPEGISWDELDNVFGGLYGENGWADVENRARNVVQFGRAAQEDIDDILRSDDIPATKAARLQRRLDTARRQAGFSLRRMNNFRQRLENEPDAAKRKELAKEIYGQNQVLLGQNLQAIKYEMAISEVVPSRKKTPVKKVAAKKKSVKKKAPAKKAAARRVTPAGGGDAVPPRMSTQPPAEAAPRVVSVFNLPNGNFLDSDLSAAPARIDAINGADLGDGAGSIFALREMRDAVELQPLAVFELRDGQRISAADLSRNITATIQAWERQGLRHQEWLASQRAQEANAARLRRPSAPPTPPRAAAPEAVADPPLNGLRSVFAGRDLGFQRDYVAEKRRINELNHNFDGMSEEDVLTKMREFQTNLDYNREYLRNLESLNPDVDIAMPNNRIVKAGDLKEEVKGVVDAWAAAQALGNARLTEINANRLPGMAGQRMERGQVADGFATIDAARTNMDRLVNSNPDQRFLLIEHDNKFYVVSGTQLNRAKLNGLSTPTIRERKGGLPLADELPPVDSDVARQAKARVDAQIIKRQRILADYLNKRYGEGNAPWKEMTPERLQSLAADFRRGDAEAKRVLKAWATEMYSHAEIEGMNGKTYRTRATADMSGGRSIGISVIIERKLPDGSWTNVGRSSRTIGLGNPPSVSNNTMFIDVPEDKNAGIQTIYNQHAFMYAKAAGYTHFHVSAASDGPYVWAKVGFREQVPRHQVSQINREVEKFRAGQPSIIKTESDARIVEHLVGEWIRNENGPRHMDFILAVSNGESSESAKKARERALKDWFITNMSFSSGDFYLAENDIMADPRERV
jgi:hypothetical protein